MTYAAAEWHSVFRVILIIFALFKNVDRTDLINNINRQTITDKKKEKQIKGISNKTLPKQVHRYKVEDFTNERRPKDIQINGGQLTENESRKYLNPVAKLFGLMIMIMVTMITVLTQLVYK